MRRTKIVCTLGPSSNSRSEILRLAQAGMDVARLNFSHATHDEHRRSLAGVRAAAQSVGRPIGVLQDLPGPKIRIGAIGGGTVQLDRGSRVRFEPEVFSGTAERISLPLPRVIEALRPGSHMYLADGLLHLRVVEQDSDGITAVVISGGTLGSNKGVNLPDVDVSLPSALETDLEHFRTGLDMGVDWVAISFVNGAADAEPFREAARKKGSLVRLLAKVERRQALKNIDEIIEAFDGILVARGDLGIETPITQVPVVQKTLVRKCRTAGKPVIVATQMLMSMVNSPRPTRAEAADVANAIFDGADAVMLSEETAIGKFPSRCVTTMARIATSTERYVIRARKSRLQAAQPTPGSVNDAIGFHSSRLAEHLGVSAVVTCTATGETARSVSKHRPAVPILAAASGPYVCGQLTLSWGVRPIYVGSPSGIDGMMSDAIEGAVATKVVKSGDRVVITAGVQAGIPGNTSLIKFHRVGDPIWESTHDAE